jgi:rod shape-determining protein MreD
MHYLVRISRRMLDWTAWRLIPFSYVALLLLVPLLPTPFAHIAPIMPEFDTALIYYGCLFCHRLFTPWRVFSLGLLEDALYSTPLGFIAIHHVCMYLLISNQRQFLTHKSFAVIWAGFGLTLCFSQCVYGGLLWWWQHSWIPLDQAAIVRLGITLCSYAWLHELSSRIFTHAQGMQRHARG